MGKLLRKNDLNKFLYKIKTQNELIAPVKSDAVRYEQVNFISQINLSKIPDFSPKRYFLPQKDELFHYKDLKISSPLRVKDRVIFGIRLCDINAVDVLDKIFLKKDPNYTKRRDKTTLIGIKCEKEVEKNCFCQSINTNNPSDLFFHDLGDSYYIEVKTDKGMKLVSRLKDYDYEPEKIKNKKFLESKELSGYFNSKLWGDMAKKCFSCGICTTICPTCHCHVQEDILTLQRNVGVRIRDEASCQFGGFWQEHDDAHLKMDKAYKQRHRVMHKLSYFRKTNGVDMCTGCGRCITFCPAGIDIVKTVNNLK